MGRTCSTLGNRTGVHRVWVGRPERKIALGRHRSMWDDIETNFQEEECLGMDWIDLADDRDRWWVLVNAVMNLGVE